MHVQSERLSLTPSDVTAFLACEHLTTLSLRHARGEIDRPDVANDPRTMERFLRRVEGSNL